MRPGRFPVLHLLGGVTIFFFGCLVGAILQTPLSAAKVETASLEPPELSQPRLAPVTRPAPVEVISGEPIVNRPIKTLIVRADGTLVSPGESAP